MEPNTSGNDNLITNPPYEVFQDIDNSTDSNFRVANRPNSLTEPSETEYSNKPLKSTVLFQQDANTQQIVDHVKVNIKQEDRDERIIPDDVKSVVMSRASGLLSKTHSTKRDVSNDYGDGLSSSTSHNQAVQHTGQVPVSLTSALKHTLKCQLGSAYSEANSQRSSQSNSEVISCNDEEKLVTDHLLNDIKDQPTKERLVSIDDASGHLFPVISSNPNITQIRCTSCIREEMEPSLFECNNNTRSGSACDTYKSKAFTVPTHEAADCSHSYYTNTMHVKDTCTSQVRVDSPMLEPVDIVSSQKQQCKSKVKGAKNPEPVYVNCEDKDEIESTQISDINKMQCESKASQNAPNSFLSSVQVGQAKSIEIEIVPKKYSEDVEYCEFKLEHINPNAQIIQDERLCEIEQYEILTRNGSENIQKSRPEPNTKQVNSMNRFQNGTESTTFEPENSNLYGSRKENAKTIEDTWKNQVQPSLFESDDTDLKILGPKTMQTEENTNIQDVTTTSEKSFGFNLVSSDKNMTTETGRTSKTIQGVSTPNSPTETGPVTSHLEKESVGVTSETLLSDAFHSCSIIKPHKTECHDTKLDERVDSFASLHGSSPLNRDGTERQLCNSKVELAKVDCHDNVPKNTVTEDDDIKCEGTKLPNTETDKNSLAQQHNGEAETCDNFGYSRYADQALCWYLKALKLNVKLKRVECDRQNAQFSHEDDKDIVASEIQSETLLKNQTPTEVCDMCEEVSLLQTLQQGLRANKYEDEDDIELVLREFESICIGNKWPKCIWARKLQPLLTDYALQAYADLKYEEIDCYPLVKGALLRLYNVNPEWRRLKFRNLQMDKDETYPEFVERTTEFYNRWLESEDVNTMQALKELHLKEKFLQFIPDDAKSILSDMKMATAMEAAELTERFLCQRKYLRHQFAVKVPALIPKSRRESWHDTKSGITVTIESDPSQTGFRKSQTPKATMPKPHHQKNHLRNAPEDLKTCVAGVERASLQKVAETSCPTADNHPTNVRTTVLQNEEELKRQLKKSGPKDLRMWLRDMNILGEHSYKEAAEWAARYMALRPKIHQRNSVSH